LPDATSFGNSTLAFVSLRSHAILSPMREQVLCVPILSEHDVSAALAAAVAALPNRQRTPHHIGVNGTSCRGSHLRIAARATVR
jgi:hypothetical protein